MISSSQRPLPDNTQHSQQTNIHVPGGIRTYDLISRRAVADLRLRPPGYWDRHQHLIEHRNKLHARLQWRHCGVVHPACCVTPLHFQLVSVNQPKTLVTNVGRRQNQCQQNDKTAGVQGWKVRSSREEQRWASFLWLRSVRVRCVRVWHSCWLAC